VIPRPHTDVEMILPAVSATGRSATAKS
jgi:hypothetical protein